MTTGVLIGRFQPIHKGHVRQIQKICEENDEVLIILGTPCKEIETSFRNPFTTDERLAMLTTVLDGYAKKPYDIRIVHDHPDNHPAWVEELRAALPKGHLKVYTGNPLVAQICESHAIPVFPVTVEYPIHSTVIRELMKEKKPWEENVPHEIVEFIKQIPYLDRMNR